MANLGFVITTSRDNEGCSSLSTTSSCDHYCIRYPIGDASDTDTASSLPEFSQLLWQNWLIVTPPPLHFNHLNAVPYLATESLTRPRGKEIIRGHESSSAFN